MTAITKAELSAIGWECECGITYYPDPAFMVFETFGGRMYVVGDCPSCGAPGQMLLTEEEAEEIALERLVEG